MSECEYKTLTTDKKLTIYCDGNPIANYRFKNPISDIPFDYIYVVILDCDLIFESAETEIEPEQQEQSDPYDDILTKVGYDKDKTYTMTEYLIILENISNEPEKEINSTKNFKFMY